YGVLGLCSHGSPFTHSRPRFGPRGADSAKDFGWCEPRPVERVARWREFSEVTLSMMTPLSVMAHYHYKRPRLFEMDAVAASWVQQSGLELDLVSFSTNVRSSLSLRPQCFSLFDVLALELLLTATRADGLKQCSECGMSFVRYKREPEGRRTFCPSC